MTANNSQNIAKSGSTTFFNSSLFFPKNIRNDVFILYAFVRTLDNFIDQIPQDTKSFDKFVDQYNNALEAKTSDNEIINNFVDLIYRKNIQHEWVDAFISAMQSDLNKHKYHTMEELNDYMFGSAEVIGLFMVKIFELKSNTYSYAQLLGRAFQYINFIRDIDEDNNLNRQYLPEEELRKFGLNDLTKQTATANQESFNNFIKAQINNYRSWQNMGMNGLRLLPKKYRTAVKTAADMYLWTADQIEKNPFVVYDKKIKPKGWQIKLNAIKNFILG